jgi:hypothetical protein
MKLSHGRNRISGWSQNHEGHHQEMCRVIVIHDNKTDMEPRYLIFMKPNLPYVWLALMNYIECFLCMYLWGQIVTKQKQLGHSRYQNDWYYFQFPSNFPCSEPINHQFCYQDTWPQIYILRHQN